MAFATLKTRAEFLRVRGGRRWGTPSLVLETRPRPGATGGDEEARFGFTVSKKIGGAVVRNRVRRRLRALVAALRPSDVRSGCDYVVIARPGAVGRTFSDLAADLQQALNRVHRPGSPRHQRS